MNANALLTYLDSRRRALPDLVGPAPASTAALHRALLEENPELYARVLADPKAHVSHRREALASLLKPRSTDQSLVPVATLVAHLRSLDAPEALAVLEVLRERRLNSGRVRRFGLSFLLGHPELPALAATRRQRVARLLKHFLGERSWSALGRELATNPAAKPRSVAKHIEGSPADPASAWEALRFLTARAPEAPEDTPRAKPDERAEEGAAEDRKSPGLFRRLLGARAERPSTQALRSGAVPERSRAASPLEDARFANELLERSARAREDLEYGAGLPRATLFGIRGVYAPEVDRKRVRELAASRGRAVREDGPLTALSKNARDLGESTSRRLLNAAQSELRARLPRLDTEIAIILDLSRSTASSGERRKHPAALGAAITRVLCSSLERARVYQVGGAMGLDEAVLPEPEGESDLATALLEAVRDRPEVVLIVTDGYENLRQGDVADVARGLERLRFDTSILQVVPVFLEGEQLELRSLGETIPLVPIVHEDEARELLARCALHEARDETTLRDETVIEELIFGRPAN